MYLLLPWNIFYINHLQLDFTQLICGSQWVVVVIWTIVKYIKNRSEICSRYKPRITVAVFSSIVDPEITGPLAGSGYKMLFCSVSKSKPIWSLNTHNNTFQTNLGISKWSNWSSFMQIFLKESILTAFLLLFFYLRSRTRIQRYIIPDTKHTVPQDTRSFYPLIKMSATSSNLSRIWRIPSCSSLFTSSPSGSSGSESSMSGSRPEFPSTLSGRWTEFASPLWKKKGKLTVVWISSKDS